MTCPIQPLDFGTFKTTHMKHILLLCSCLDLPKLSPLRYPTHEIMLMMTYDWKWRNNMIIVFPPLILNGQLLLSRVRGHRIMKFMCI